MRIVVRVGKGAVEGALRTAAAAGLNAWRGNRDGEVVVEGWPDRVNGWVATQAVERVHIVFSDY